METPIPQPVKNPTVKNSYPELPEVPFFKTKVEMPLVVIFAKTLVGKYPAQFVRMAYAMFRNESANGTSGVNNNYGGIQADVGRWKNLPGTPIATCIRKDNGGDVRRFLCFNNDGYKTCFELMVIKAQERNMVTAQDYYKSWVGNPNQPDKNIKSFQSMIDAGAKVF